MNELAGNREHVEENSWEKYFASISDVINATPSCLYLLNENAQLLKMNKRALEIMEVADASMVYMANVYDLIAPESKDEFIAFHEMICNGGRGSLTFESISMGGTKRWMESYARAVELGDGKYGHLAITNDITEKIDSNKKLVEQQEILLEAGRLSALGEFAGGVAHEINNPLAIIKAKASLMKAHLSRPEIDYDYIEKAVTSIDETVERISSIIKTLKTLSRDPSLDDFEECDLVQLTKDSLSLCQKSCEVSNIKVEVVMPDEVRLKCQKVAIGQIIMNILNNAHDAIVEQENPWVTIEIKPLEDRVQMIFTDSGNGVPEEIQPKILNPFFTTKAPGQGTGLGLSFCAGVAKKHKGQLYLNTKNENTQFIVELALL